MSTAQRGIEAETEVLRALVRGGITVWLPWGEGSAADLLADIDGHLVRVQVKSGRIRGDVVVFRTYSTDHGRGPMTYVGRADVIAVHRPEVDGVFVVAVADVGRGEGTLRLRPARNNQRRRVRLAADHTLDRWLARVRAGTAARAGA